MVNYIITIWFKNGFLIKYEAQSYEYSNKGNRIDSMVIEKANKDSLVVFFDEVVAWEVKKIEREEDSLTN